MLLLACTKILGRYVYDTVRIDIEGNLDLRNTSSCRRYSVQTELTQGLIIPCKLTLTLYYVYINCSLVICCSREDLALLRRYCRISLDKSCCNTTHCLDRQ